MNDIIEGKGYLSNQLRALVLELTYKPDWQVYIDYEVAEDGAGGWHLFIVSNTVDSFNFDKRIRVRHGFLIPAASYNRDTWAAWLFERFVDVERHEAGEFFRLNGVREFAPHHSNGENPYLTWHVGDYATAAKKSGDD